MKLTSLLLALLLATTYHHAEDVRRGSMKDLNGYFPFTPPSSWEEWLPRKEAVKKQILVSQGLWPLPTKTPLNAKIHGKIDRGDYTIEKVYFESAPGLYVTGNLYRPKNPKGKVPGVLFTHGHREHARFHIAENSTIRNNVAIGAERFLNSNRSIYQSMCHQLASMGCVVWQWDMLSDSDAIQFSAEVIHKFKKQRPEMNTLKDWGLYSSQAEAHLQNVMGLQTWNAVRSLDFILDLPEIDSERVAITGASGGGTQAMLLSAIDDRIALSFPVVMVSTSMQGGCTCENATLLRTDSGNVEFAALCAPKPQGMNTADDWTREMATKGFPELQKLYDLKKAKGQLFLQRGEIFPHAYNAVTRTAFYGFINQHFKLGFQTPLLEEDFSLLHKEQLTVWNEEHPAPKIADPDFEKSLLRWFHKDAQKQLQQNPASLADIVRPALEVMIGRTLAKAGDVEWKLAQEKSENSYVERRGALHNTTYQEVVPMTWLAPKTPSQKHVIWLGDQGQATVRDKSGKLIPAVQNLLDQGFHVISAELLYQELGTDQRTRTVENPREVAAYTLGYNYSLFAQRTHDIYTLIQFLKKQGSKEIDLVAWGSTGINAAAAHALSGKAIQRVAIETKGFRFSQLLDYRHPQFLPGGAKYLDVPGILALQSPGSSLVFDEAKSNDLIAKDQFKVALEDLSDAKLEATVRWIANP